jgi:hypothetical protein
VPSTAQFADAARVIVSRPYGSGNLFAELYQRASSGELEDAVAFHAPTAAMNPTIAAKFLRAGAHARPRGLRPGIRGGVCGRRGCLSSITNGSRMRSRIEPNCRLGRLRSGSPESIPRFRAIRSDSVSSAATVPKVDSCSVSHGAGCLVGDEGSHSKNAARPRTASRRGRSGLRRVQGSHPHRPVRCPGDRQPAAQRGAVRALGTDDGDLEDSGLCGAARAPKRRRARVVRRAGPARGAGPAAKPLHRRPSWCRQSTLGRESR